MDTSVEQWQQWGRMVVQSWDDDGLRQRMVDEPEAVLGEVGMVVPEGLRVVVVSDPEEAAGFDDDATLVLPLPPRPGGDDPVRGAAELSEKDLAEVSGGVAGAAIAGALASLPYGGYLGATLRPIRIPTRWASIPTP